MTIRFDNAFNEDIPALKHANSIQEEEAKIHALLVIKRDLVAGNDRRQREIVEKNNTIDRLKGQINDLGRQVAELKAIQSRGHKDDRRLREMFYLLRAWLGKGEE